MAEVNDQQERFCQEYLVDLNATQAAARAGYSERSASTLGYQLLQKPSVVDRIAELMAERARRTEISCDRVLKELARVAFADPRAVMTWGPGGVVLKQSDELSDDDAAIVAEASQTITESGGSIRLKTHDKLKALDMVGKHLGMWSDTKNLNINIGEIDALQARQKLMSALGGDE